MTTRQSNPLPNEAEPFEERIAILAKELELAIRWQRPSLLLVVYGSEYVRAEAQAALENQLIDLGQRVIQLRLQGQHTADTVQFLKMFTPSINTIFFLQGLHWSQGQETNFYAGLNLQREFFVEKQIRVVFWLTQREIRELARGAPDFWAYRHRVIEFSESPKAEQILKRALESAWQGIGEYADELEDTDAKISLREAMLMELPEEEEASFTRANLLLTLGILYWRKGNFERAHELLQEALGLAVKIQDNWFEAECYNALALVHTGLERIDEAIRAYKQAIRLAPDQIFVWNNLGNLCAKIERNDEALAAFLKAIEYNPKDPIAWNGLGNVYAKIGYTDDAITAYRKSIQFMPNFAQPWNGLGDVYASSGRVDEALKAYNKAIELNKHYVTPWLRLGSLYARQDRFREAIRAYQRALHLDANNSAIWNELGTLYLQSESYAEAAEAFSKAIALDRANGSAYSNLALAYSKQGKHKEAVSLCLRSIELLQDDHDKAAAWNRLANIYRALNDYDNAIAAYQMADRLDLGKPGAPPARAAAEASAPEPVSSLASAPHAAQTQEQEHARPETEPPTQPSSLRSPAGPPAETDAEQSLPEAPAWMFQPSVDRLGTAMPAPEAKRPLRSEKRAQGVTMQKSEKTAVPQTNERATSAPKSPERASASVWNEKGNAHFKRGEYEAAIQAYNKALQLDPGFGWPYSNLALTYLTQGQYAEAILLYQKSIDLLDSDKDKAVCWNGLGNAYRCLNDYPNAVAAYQKAAELDPQTAGMREGTNAFQAGQNPESAQVWNELGELFFKTGAYDQAIHAFNKAIQLEPTFGWAYGNLARALSACGQYAEAIDLYKKSLDLLQTDKDKATIWNRLGNVYRKLNDYDNAIQAYQKAVILADEGINLLTRTRFSLLSNLSG